MPLKLPRLNWSCAPALHVERFTADSDLAPVASAKTDNAFEVELRQSGLVLLVPADRTLGSVLQEANVPVPFSCQEGYCGSCETRVLGRLTRPSGHNPE